MEFTDQQLSDWKAYERVRKSGKYNMFDPRARRETRLSGDAYSFVMHNFSVLKTMVENESLALADRFPKG